MNAPAEQAPGAGRRLSREGGDGRPKAPVKLLHLGVGNFFRAHQAYYAEMSNAEKSNAETSNAEKSNAETSGPGSEQEWGYAAFTGRSAAIADELAPQDGLYTLIIKHADRTDNVVISSISAVHPGPDVAALRAYFASPDLAVVTSTVTEAGYVRDAQGALNLADEKVVADLAALQADPLGGDVVTAPGKFVAGLLARRAAGAGAITFVPCDNVPDNGLMVQRVITDLAAQVDPTLAGWIADHCSFVTTMVDRITPRTTDEDRAALLAQTGVADPAAVVTEPFEEWVLQGEFVAGRPAWEKAGARFVADIRPFEQRKLWLLNGSHSLMAYTGPLLGRETVFDAIGDERIRGWVEEWWDVAQRHLPLPQEEITDYRAALIDRYENPNIRHLLTQIAADGSQKIAIRHVPALLADRAAGQMPTGATPAIAAWTLHLRGLGAPVNDALADEVTAAASGTLEEGVRGVLRFLKVDDAAVEATVLEQARELESMAKGA